MTEFLPFLDLSFDATMAVLTFHHWTDQSQGLVEVMRVTRKRIVMSPLIRYLLSTFGLLGIISLVLKTLMPKYFPTREELVKP